MEPIIESTTVHGKGCAGCIRHERDVMIAFKEENAAEGQFIDVFLTQEQAASLLEQLKAVVDRNDVT